MAENRQKTRRRFQFRLRTLMIVVAFVAATAAVLKGLV